MTGERGEFTHQDLDRLKGVIGKIIGPDVHPRVAVIDAVTDRLTQGADAVTYMRVSMYVSDLADVVESSAEDRDVQEMLEDLREMDGYQGLNTVMHVPDETSIKLMAEIRQKLAGMQPQNLNL